MFQEYCSDEFWSNNTWGQNFPEVSRCFQETCLDGLLFLFLLMSAPCYYYKKKRSYLKLCEYADKGGPFVFKSSISYLLSIKILTIVSIILVITIEFILTVFSEEELHYSTTVAYFLKLTTFTFNIYLNICDAKYAIVGSAVQFCFWLITVIFSLPRIQTIMTDSDIQFKMLSSMYCCLVLLEFFAQNFAENFPQFRLSPEERSGFVQRVTFHWLNGVIYKGFKNNLKASGLPTIRKIFDVKETVREYENVKTRTNSKLIHSLIYSNIGALAAAAFFRFVCIIIIVINPQIQKLMIKHILSADEEPWRGYLFAFMLLVFCVLQTTCKNQFHLYGICAAIRMRTAVVSEIFQKTLKLSNRARQLHSTGQITNLMAIDSQRFLEVIPYVHLLWSAPFQIGLNSYFMYREMGLSSFAGILVLFLVLPINFACSKLSKTMQVKNLNLKDHRIKLMNEIINSIKVLKLYGWEIPFLSKVRDTRADEIRIVKKQGHLAAITEIICSMIEFLMIVATVGAFLLMDPNGTLRPEKLFVCISLISNIRNSLFLYPIYFTKSVLLLVSIKRISSFLSAEELKRSREFEVEKEAMDGGKVSLKNCDFSWNGDDLTLRDVDIEFPKKSLTAIIGKVGSGKSTLLNSIFGETERRKGDVIASGTISFASQQPWIQNMTVKENILFGSKFNFIKYGQVLEICALNEDLKLFPNGDGTIIGENGINLSGGQKQRISLARSLYKDADIYIFDDPLSAVDAHVGEHIFYNVIGPHGYLKNKTRLVALNSINYLPHSDHIVWLKDGTVYASNTYEELSKNDFLKYIEATNIIAKNENENSESSEMVKKNTFTANDEDVNIMEEKVGMGGKPFRLFGEFIKFLGGMNTFFIISTFIAGRVAFMLSNIILAQWTDNKKSSDLNSKNFVVFSVIGFCAIFIEISRSILLWSKCAKAAKRMHNNLLEKVIHSPMRFFDLNPTGRILNRFSTDIAVIDSEIPSQLSNFLFGLFHILSVMVIITYSNPIFLMVFFPLLVIYLTIQRFYVATSRQLKRFESVARSPIFTHFNETINGSPIIRAFVHEQRFMDESFEKVHDHLKVYYLGRIGDRWLGFRTEIMGGLITFFAALFSVMNRDVMGAGFAGLLISYSLSVSSHFAGVVQTMCALETSAVSFERINEYINEEQEDDWIKENSTYPESWPSVGKIEFRKFSTRYREKLPLTLKNINFEIMSGEKIGVCGRTGAGKSSLSLSLFRLIEATEGMIFIDDVNIVTLGLHVLRQRLTIIPQDPVLFMGTIRFNLDPNDLYEEDDLWKALENVYLKGTVENLEGGLSHLIQENGANMSVGQRQLICLARALLRKTKILVLDEATAAIDFETDRLIQTIISKEFEDCTVITIAHRLHTILNSDKILVLDQGIVAEFGEPKELFQNVNSFFYSLTRASGIVSLD